MKTKRFLILTLIAILAIATSVPTAWAGSAQRHRLEGAVIGIGALILTQAIINQQHHAYAAEARPATWQPPQPAGYWQTQRQWVPAQYKRVWNPGHYDRRGHWVNGHWMQVELRPGYWTEKRVWVPNH